MPTRCHAVPRRRRLIFGHVFEGFRGGFGGVECRGSDLGRNACLECIRGSAGGSCDIPQRERLCRAVDSNPSEEEPEGGQGGEGQQDPRFEGAPTALGWEFRHNQRERLRSAGGGLRRTVRETHTRREAITLWRRGGHRWQQPGLRLGLLEPASLRKSVGDSLWKERFLQGSDLCEFTYQQHDRLPNHWLRDHDES